VLDHADRDIGIHERYRLAPRQTICQCGQESRLARIGGTE
jgi:hypothetical protein